MRQAAEDIAPRTRYDETRETPVFDRARLPAGAQFLGPAVVEEAGATTIVPPGWSAAVLEYGEMLLTVTP